MNIWSQRHLSLFGRIEIVNSLAMSRYYSRDQTKISYKQAVNAIRKCELVERNAAISKQVIQKHMDKWGNMYILLSKEDN